MTKQSKEAMEAIQGAVDELTKDGGLLSGLMQEGSGAKEGLMNQLPGMINMLGSLSGGKKGEGGLPYVDMMKMVEVMNQMTGNKEPQEPKEEKDEAVKQEKVETFNPFEGLGLGNMGKMLESVKDMEEFGDIFTGVTDGANEEGIGCDCEHCTTEDGTVEVEGQGLDKYREHYLFSRAVKGIEDGDNILIVGGAGKGKTTLAKELASVALTVENGREGVYVLEEYNCEEALNVAEELLQDSEQFIATVQADKVGQAFDNLIELAGGAYDNLFDIVIGVNYNPLTGEGGIESVTELRPKL